MWSIYESPVSVLAGNLSTFMLTTNFYRPAVVMAPSVRGGAVPNVGTDGVPGIGEPGDRRDDGAVVHGAQF